MDKCIFISCQFASIIFHKSEMNWIFEKNKFNGKFVQDKCDNFLQSLQLEVEIILIISVLTIFRSVWQTEYCEHSRAALNLTRILNRFVCLGSIIMAVATPQRKWCMSENSRNRSSFRRCRLQSSSSNNNKVYLIHKTQYKIHSHSQKN